MLLRYTISFLMIGRLVIAQSFNCSASTIQINSSTEATALAQQCQFYPQLGINFGDSISGNISFNGLQTCASLGDYGDTAPTPNLTGVASNSLYLVQAILSFTSSPALQTLSFPNLREGILLAFELLNLPLLTELEFNASLIIPGRILIIDTGLKSFSLPADTSTSPYDCESDYVVIRGNPYMSRIYLGLKRTIATAIGREFTISQNGPGAIIDMPDLISLNWNTSTFSDFSSLNIPGLQVVNGSFNINNAYISRFSAPSLQNIGGNFNLTGDFSEIDLPALSAVNGNIYIRGAAGLNCGLFNNVSINGTLDCDGTAIPRSTPTTIGSTSTPTTTGSTSTPTTTGSTTTATSGASTRLSSGAKGGIGGGIAAGVLFIIVLAVWYFWQKRRSSSTFSDKGSEHKKTDGKVAAAELSSSRHHERSELQASPNQVFELTGDQEYGPSSPI